MSNLRKNLEKYEVLFGEPIEAMVVGKHDSISYHREEAKPDENVVLTREVGLAKVDQEYDSGYGSSPDCFPLYAWTKSRVFYVHEYDGATGLVWAPRNPMVVEPSFGGQYE